MNSSKVMADVLLYLTNIMQRFSFGQPNLNLNRKDKGSIFITYIS